MLNPLVYRHLYYREYKTAWELDKEASKYRHVHAPLPGYLMSQDGKLIASIAGIGRVYVQVGIDCASSFGWARLYTNKTADSSADFLKRTFLDYESMGVKLQRALTDNGKEYGSVEPNIGHHYGATCYFLGIKHKTTKVKHPWTNGFAERFIQTLYQEFFQVALRRKKYTSIKELRNSNEKVSPFFKRLDLILLTDVRNYDVISRPRHRSDVYSSLCIFNPDLWVILSNVLPHPLEDSPRLSKGIRYKTGDVADLCYAFR